MGAIKREIATFVFRRGRESGASVTSRPKRDSQLGLFVPVGSPLLTAGSERLYFDCSVSTDLSPVPEARLEESRE